MSFKYKGRVVEQISEINNNNVDDYSIQWEHSYICDGKHFETIHDLECYIDPTYLLKLQARKKSERKKKVSK